MSTIPIGLLQIWPLVLRPFPAVYGVSRHELFPLQLQQSCVLLKFFYATVPIRALVSECCCQMVRLGFFSYHLKLRLGLELSIELHRTDLGPFKGRSTDWATAPRLLRKILQNIKNCLFLWIRFSVKSLSVRLFLQSPTFIRFSSSCDLMKRCQVRPNSSANCLQAHHSYAFAFELELELTQTDKFCKASSERALIASYSARRFQKH